MYNCEYGPVTFHHGLDTVTELANILTTQIISEVNREKENIMYNYEEIKSCGKFVMYVVYGNKVPLYQVAIGTEEILEEFESLEEATEYFEKISKTI